MRSVLANTAVIAIASVIVALLSGCAADLGGSESALAGEPSIAVAPAGVTWTVARGVWVAAPAGCEGVRGQGLAGDPSPQPNLPLSYYGVGEP
ncbi:MAG: hypothetical protein K8H88_34730 [Sandaracinaceae bacterium]|nr:hypothetical protein [Sandaracinaceae bacterium]